MGESQGDCGKTDFMTELSGYQEVFDEMLKYDFILLRSLSWGSGDAEMDARAPVEMNVQQGNNSLLFGLQTLHVLSCNRIAVFGKIDDHEAVNDPCLRRDSLWSACKYDDRLFEKLTPLLIRSRDPFGIAATLPAAPVWPPLFLISPGTPADLPFLSGRP